MAGKPRDPTEEEWDRTVSSCDMGGGCENLGIALAWDEEGGRYLPCCAVCLVTLKPRYTTRRFVTPSPPWMNSN